MITKDLALVSDALTSGGLAAIPTETVYGLAASITHPEALRKIFETKERPFFDPLIVHIGRIDQVKDLVSVWLRNAEILAEAFWPGPLTIVLPKSHHVNPMITAGLSSVGIRMPKHPLTLELLQRVAIPLAAPSANKFGKTSPTTAEHVRSEFGDSLLILDGGPCDLGLESTVVRPFQGRVEILRPGMITAKMIETAFREAGVEIQVNEVASNASPGHLDQHYQPKVPLLVLDRESDLASEISRLSLKGRGLELELGDDSYLAARFLYASLRELSKDGDFIWVVRKSAQAGEAWEAIWDRLGRAAWKK